jgi:hypothetical protein
MSNIHTLQKIFPAGFDNGYGSLKLLVDGFEVVRVPSYITNAEMEDVPGRVVFNGTAYTVGESAYRTGNYFDRNTDNNDFETTLVLLSGS